MPKPNTQWSIPFTTRLSTTNCIPSANRISSTSYNQTGQFNSSKWSIRATTHTPTTACVSTTTRIPTIPPISSTTRIPTTTRIGCKRVRQRDYSTSMGPDRRNYHYQAAQPLGDRWVPPRYQTLLLRRRKLRPPVWLPSQISSHHTYSFGASPGKTFLVRHVVRTLFFFFLGFSTSFCVIFFFWTRSRTSFARKQEVPRTAAEDLSVPSGLRHFN